MSASLKPPSKLFMRSVKGFFGALGAVAIMLTGFTIWPPPDTALAQSREAAPCAVKPADVSMEAIGNFTR